MPTIGPMEVVIVLVIALLILGPKRLPEAGKSLGQSVRGFRSALTEKSSAPEGEEQPSS
jgi:sec-independent protein translocase protein TatA